MQNLFSHSPYIEKTGHGIWLLGHFLENMHRSSPQNGCNYTQFKACLVSGVALRVLWISEDQYTSPTTYPS